MKTLYTTPNVEIVEFDAKDVITTSGLTNSENVVQGLGSGTANEEQGWSGLY